MKVLSLYLLRQNLFLLFAFVCVGAGLFAITDLFERLDEFLRSGLGPGRVAYYFLLRLPLIVYTIFPAVYLISLVAQLVMLESSRERMALASGGVSPFAVARFVIVYGVALAAVQFVFGQLVGVAADREAALIWQVEVRGRILEEAKVRGLWFKEGRNIIHLALAYPAARTGQGVIVYVLDEKGVEIDEIIKAERFRAVTEGVWSLENGVRLKPHTYSAETFRETTLPVKQDLRAFQVVERSMGMDPERFSLPELYEIISRLEEAGSNVEALRTAMFSKVAYAFSIIVMGVLALLVSGVTGSLYKAVALAVIVIFFYHGANSLFLSMGEKSIVSPLTGAWAANIVFLAAGLLWATRTFVAVVPVGRAT
ncbi:MAG: LptF/LptG family permease [Desulfovibrio sp.]|jgi:lipopolysaccharide export system permease protein|nr:LptF/LptG family permease [Desulfovibrio sp.]